MRLVNATSLTNLVDESDCLLVSLPLQEFEG